MIRNLKALGLTLTAALALGAAVVSSASAQTQGELTFDGPTKLTGTDTVDEPIILLYSATQKYTCHGNYHAGEVNQTEEFPTGSGKFTHKKVPGNAKLTTLTITPTYSGCSAEIGELKAPATVTMNGCDYVLHFGKTTGIPPQYGPTLDYVCPAGKEIELHVYSNATHETSICTYKFGPQVGKTGSFIQNEAGKITHGGTTTGIHATRSGILCGGNNTTNTASLSVHIIFEGRNEVGGATHITLTEV